MPRAKDEVKRDGILLAAKHLFAQKGFHHTSMTDIKRESGLPVGTIYTYFSSKEEIVQTIIDEGWQNIATRVFTSLNQAENLEEKVDILVRHYLPEIFRDTDLIDILLTEALEFTKLQEKLDKIVELVSNLRSGYHWQREPQPGELYSSIVVYFLGMLYSIRLARSSNHPAFNVDSIQKFIARHIIKIIKEGPVGDH